ncbi:3-oxoacyl-ACP reductase FabG [Cnuibacter physcomitrellae]|uniref:3-oxoacyl-ACP reductase FabG n=1 Tax=Cnuibacter physcomitrellae TaxID=1619308 RepID=UPI002175E469|nr:3-oxoacyl-ACP reductase FabG [Cnuibacter physcomitrellae]MCS5498327.1 3-oxoacyl-ACP reductase FabG [Cnuibacter physcomitrellae]
MSEHDTARVAVITGGAQGIGQAIARRLSADGLTIAIVDLDADAATAAAGAIVDAGGRARAYAVDITQEDAVESLRAEVAADLGPADVLVNNAGITRDNLLFKMTTVDWDSVMGVHLRGAFLMSRAFHSGMREKGWGRIVSLSSTSADGNRGQGNYSAAKAGIVGFTKTLAKELGRFGITANAVSPGFIDTRMLRATAERLGISFGEFTDRSVEGIPARRFGTPDDVASAVSFLAGDAASYITGENIHVSGGFHE